MNTFIKGNFTYTFGRQLYTENYTINIIDNNTGDEYEMQCNFNEFRNYERTYYDMSVLYDHTPDVRVFGNSGAFTTALVCYFNGEPDIITVDFNIEKQEFCSELEVDSPLDDFSTDLIDFEFSFSEDPVHSIKPLR